MILSDGVMTSANSCPTKGYVVKFAILLVVNASIVVNLSIDLGWYWKTKGKQIKDLSGCVLNFQLDKYNCYVM